MQNLQYYGDDENDEEGTASEITQPSHVLSGQNSKVKGKRKEQPSKSKRKKKKRKVPPLPSALFGPHNLLNKQADKHRSEADDEADSDGDDVDDSSDDTSDERDKHQGRIRTFPHVEGNFATYVYISVEATPQIQDAIEEITAKKEFSEFRMKQFSHNFHISLSRTFTLRYQQIDVFVESLRQSINCQQFGVTFSEFEYYSNDEKTRSFIGLCVSSGKSKVIKLIHQADKALAIYDFPPYYEDPKPHLSIAWCLGTLPSLPGTLQKSSSVEVRYVECKVGNRPYKFQLHAPSTSSSTLSSAS